MGFFYLIFSGTLPLPLHLGLRSRWLVALMLSGGLGLLCGLPVPWAMKMVQEKAPRTVGWMWAINSGFNVIGSLFFLPLVIVTSISTAALTAAGIYLIALTIVPLPKK